MARRDALKRPAVYDRPSSSTRSCTLNDGNVSGTAEGFLPLGIAVYLASDASAYTTGEQFVIDGGYTKF